VTAETWTLPARLEAPSVARRLARGFAAEHDADEDTVAAVALCVSEAVANVVVHAYRDADQPGDVEIEAHKPNGYLCVYVRDRGQGMTPRLDSPGLGLGLPVIAQSATALEVRRSPTGGTELAMRFDLTEAAATG
jgi:anti-sigma regulatory factor (Ser/Thr protein kinase)